MHRIDRVARKFFVSTADNVVKNAVSAANFAATAGATLSTRAVQVDIATLLDPVSSVSWFLNTEPSFAVGDVWSAGRFVPGTHEPENVGKPMMYSITGYCEAIFSAAPDSFSLMCEVGKLNTGSVTVDHTTAVNAVDQPHPLPVDVVQNGNSLTAKVDCDVVDGLFGSAAAFDDQPFGAFWTLLNDGAAAVTLDLLIFSMSIYRYSQDVDTFDPPR